MKVHLSASCLFALAAVQTACVSSPDPNLAAAQERASHTAMRSDLARLTERANQDPLLAPWTGAYGGVPPWNNARPELVPAAFELGIALQSAEIDAIASNPAEPTFENTIEALQDAGRHLGRATTIFSVMTDNVSNESIQALEAEWSPRLTAAFNAITFNRRLFDRIAVLHERRDSLGLSAEQLRLLERTYNQLARAGAAAGPEQQIRLGQINEELATKFAEFSRRLLADENTAIFITSEADLIGLPDNLRDAYAAAAADRGRPGQWAVANTRSSVDPFLTFSADRRLREQVWRAFKNRGDNGDANDTNAIIADILRLRAERARILGFPTHAHFRMSDTMAQNPARAHDLMLRVWRPAVARVREEVAAMQAIADSRRAGITIEPWDYLYYAEQVRRQRYNLDQNEVRAYFELNRMVDGAFYMANRLYGLSFREITGAVPVFEEGVRTFEVTDRDGSFVGLFYLDNFARAGKRSGAWALSYQGHETFTGRVVTPITSNNNNFVRGGAGEPVLISLDDARTLFHEFGHALHTLMSEVDYPGLAATPRDYVEFPSQVHEHWVLTRPILDRFARHYLTGEPMPQQLVNRIAAAATFNQGYETVELVSSGLVDMMLHNRSEPVSDVDAFERETLEALGMPREMAMRHRLPQFAHLFSSDTYSAGYYSYLWSEVMDADTWEMFEQSGDLFDAAAAAGMRTIILAEGNSSDRAEAYRRFRGRDPDVGALLRVRGLLAED
jgi:peptidyl-dipeptidase Dcp